MTNYFRPILLLIVLAFAGVLSAQDYEPPRDRLDIDPVYPAEALKAVPTGGTITLLLEIDTTGRVYGVSAFGPSLDCQSPDNPLFGRLRDSAVDAARQSLFIPAYRGNLPVIGKMIKTYKIKPSQSPATDPAKAEEFSGPFRSHVPRLPSVENGGAILLPRPAYPPKARAARIWGAVSVNVLIDEEGNVYNAEPTSGHPLLYQAAAEAACRAKFSPTLLSGSAVKLSGVITYNFVL